MSDQHGNSNQKPLEDTPTNQDEIDMDAHEERRVSGGQGPGPEHPVEDTPEAENANPEAVRPDYPAGTQEGTGSG